MGYPTTPTWDKFPHVPVFLWQTSLKPFPTNALSHNTIWGRLETLEGIRKVSGDSGYCLEGYQAQSIDET